MTDTVPDSFDMLELPHFLLDALKEVGYEQPSPIQAECIPHLLEGRDLLGMAQTGTGKTAAFALPLLAQIDISKRAPQVLVLAPTRELAIQVAEAFQRYACKINKFHVLPIYGGQDYKTQLRALERGPHVVVGTPGRVMDHLKKGKLVLKSLKTVVLDEADEMLRMGFIDDVTWIMDNTPDDRRVALFSATMPVAIQRVTQDYLKDPVVVKIKSATKTLESTEQQYWLVKGTNKLDALTRILEAETFDAIIIFVRTKNSSTELAEKLEARGYAVTAINGDMNQAAREHSIDRLKNGKFDIIVATDVAARGIDVPRVSHVINYDIPYDNEAYVHRIGRTGRAGRKGKAIMFVAPRERRLLQSIEKSTGQTISLMQLPSREEVADKRIANFKALVEETLEKENLGFYTKLANELVTDELPAEALQAALLFLAQKDRPLLMPAKEKSRDRSESRKDISGKKENRKDTPRKERKDRKGKKRHKNDEGVAHLSYKIQVGRNQGVQPKDIVGAIANEAGLDSEYIGKIVIHDDFSMVDLPDGMPKEVFKDLRDTWVCGQKMNLELDRETVKKRSGKQGAGKKKATKSDGKKSRPKEKNAKNSKSVKKRAAHRKGSESKGGSATPVRRKRIKKPDS